jgi:peptide/nickel transport system substrate-binding protein
MPARFFTHLFLFSCAFLGLLVIHSCSPATKDAEGVFCYNESAGIPTLDPAFAKNQAVMWPVHQIFNTLIEIDDSMRMIPSLCKSWESSADALTFIFHLRTDVTFHDDSCFPGGHGRRMVASDIVYSFRRLLDPATASPGNWIFHGRVDSLHPFLAINDSTFQISLRRPFRPLLGILSMPYCSVIPREAVSYYGSGWRRHPVGTGPFRFLSWEEGQALVLKRNPDYFEKDQEGKRLPYLAGIKVRFLDSKATEFLEFRQGELDFINDVDPSFKDELLTRKGALRKNWEGRIQLLKSPYLNVEYLGMLTDTAFAGARWSASRPFRKALAEAIDRRRLIFYLRNSIGLPAELGFIPPSLAGHLKFPIRSADHRSVKSYLDEAGYHPGSEDPIVLYTVPAYSNLGTFIVSEWNKNGIAARVEVMQKSALLDQMAAGRIPFFRGSWIADYPDAENYLGVFYGKNPAPPNYTHFQNETYDRLYEKALAESDDSLRLSLYESMDSLITEEMPAIPLWYDEVLNLLQPRISGYRPNPRNMMELRYVRKNKKD